MNKKDIDEAVNSFKEKYNYDEEIILLDGFEDAFTGIISNGGSKPRACYDKSIIIEIMMEAMGSEEMAVEYFNDNIYSACLGEDTPIFLD